MSQQTNSDIPQNLADAFVEAAISGKLSKAAEALRQRPDLASANIATAVVSGHVEALRQFLDTDPNAVNGPRGPRNRPPLLYATFSCLTQHAEYRQGILAVIRLLLERGANVNAEFREEPWLDWPIPPLYGAIGLMNDVELATILIDAGADINHDEALYHALDHRDHVCLRLLLSRGAIPQGNTLHHALDFDDLEAVSLLLKHGANPNGCRNGKGEPALIWAIQRGRSLPIITALVEAGADVNAAFPPDLPAYRIALRNGRRDVADYLELRGADTKHDVTDDFFFAAHIGDFDALAQIRGDDPSIDSRLTALSAGMLTASLESGNVIALKNMLDAGFPTNGRGEANATPLHWASWRANVDAVALLVDRGADLEARGTDFGNGNPLQWCFHGSGNNSEANPDDFIAVIDILLEAGSTYYIQWLDMAPDLIRERYKHVPERPYVA